MGPRTEAQFLLARALEHGAIKFGAKSDQRRLSRKVEHAEQRLRRFCAGKLRFSADLVNQDIVRVACTALAQHGSERIADAQLATFDANRSNRDHAVGASIETRCFDIDDDIA